MRVGIHASTKGNTEQNRAVANALGAEVFVWMADCHQPHDTEEWPDATHILRLPNPRCEPRESTADYAARVLNTMDNWYQHGIKDLWFQIGNEPDIEGYDLSPAWGVDLWKQVAGQYLANLRHNFPDAKFLSTPFSAHGVVEYDSAYMDPFDGVGIHYYWPAESPLVHGLALRSVGKPVYLTEVNSNPTDPHQLADFFLHSSGIDGAAIFLADAPPDFAHYDLSPLDAGVIRALLAEPPAPPPFEPPAPKIIGRDAYRFHNLDWDQYNQIVTNGSMGGSIFYKTSDIYDSLITVCHAADIDPRWFLAIVQSETNFGTNPNAASVPNNFAGIKYVGQVGATDSGVPYPSNEGAGTYAAFGTVSDFWRELVRIMHNDIIGPSFDAGDLLTAAVHYTGGDWGKVKIDIWREMVVNYPPAATGPTLDMIHRMAANYIGATLTEEGNPEYGMCEQWVEEVLADAGLPRTRFYSAAIHGDDLIAEGVLHTGSWPIGAVLVWGRAFDPNGHICIGDTFPNVITTYPGKIALLSATTAGWYPNPGFLGWYIPAGVVEEDDMAMPDDGKADDGIHKDAWLRTGIPLNEASGFYTKWLELIHAKVPIGVPFSQETPASDGRTIQHFTSGWTMTYVDGRVYVN